MLRIRTKIFTSICRDDDYDEDNDDIFFIYNKFKQYASAMNNVIAGESTADSKAMLAYSLGLHHICKAVLAYSRCYSDVHDKHNTVLRNNKSIPVIRTEPLERSLGYRTPDRQTITCGIVPAPVSGHESLAFV